VSEYGLPDAVWGRRDEKEVRDLIVLTYWPMVTRIVGKIRYGLPPHVRVEEDDLRSYGLIGLYKAMDRFDPSLGHAFDKFASNAVWGAVMDELRAQDWAPRSLRKRQKDLHRATTQFVNEHGRLPSTEEIAEALRWTVADVSVTRKQIDTAWPRSLDELRGEAERDLYSIVADALGQVEEHVLRHNESHENDRSAIINDQMMAYIDNLTPQKRAVVVFCYYLDMKMSEVAAILGISESKVGSINREIMEQIHARLESLLTG
jgi:RNA polymerase sigma factor for flagellar operon FliA